MRSLYPRPLLLSLGTTKSLAPCSAPCLWLLSWACSGQLQFSLQPHHHLHGPQLGSPQRVPVSLVLGSTPGGASPVQSRGRVSSLPLLMQPWTLLCCSWSLWCRRGPPGLLLPSFSFPAGCLQHILVPGAVVPPRGQDTALLTELHEVPAAPFIGEQPQMLWVAAPAVSTLPTGIIPSFAQAGGQGGCLQTSGTKSLTLQCSELHPEVSRAPRLLLPPPMSQEYQRSKGQGSTRSALPCWLWQEQQEQLSCPRAGAAGGKKAMGLRCCRW